MKVLKYGLLLMTIMITTSLSAQNDIFDAIMKNDLVKVTNEYLSLKNANTIKSEDGFGLLAFAIYNERPDAINILMDLGADVHCTTRKGTPLHMAVLKGDMKALELLLDYGVDIDAKNIRDQTPLIIAAKYNNQQAIDYLIAQGADMRTQDIRKMTAYDYAVRFDSRNKLTESGHIFASVN